MSVLSSPECDRFSDVLLPVKKTRKTCGVIPSESVEPKPEDYRRSRCSLERRKLRRLTSFAAAAGAIRQRLRAQRREVSRRSGLVCLGGDSGPLRQLMQKVLHDPFDGIFRLPAAAVVDPVAWKNANPELSFSNEGRLRRGGLLRPGCTTSPSGRWRDLEMPLATRRSAVTGEH